MTPQEAGRVAVLCGGWSAERDVSLQSGANACEALKRQGIDAEIVDATRALVAQIRDGGFTRAFVALHGPAGEDGMVQAALDLAGIPYTGSGVLASALAMSKLHSKLIWQACGLPTPAFERLNQDSDWQAVVERLGLPLFIKPGCEGSSVGVSRVESEDGMEPAFLNARTYDATVLAEACASGGEYTATCLDGRMLPIVKIIPAGKFYDFDAKYLSDDTRYECPSDLGEREAELQLLCKQAFDALGAQGWGRVDFLLDAEGAPQLIELNTQPGLTTHSLAPMAAAAAGIEFDEFMLRILGTSRIREYQK